MNTSTPRVFIAATRQNDGKTTTSLGLLSALQKHYPRVGYIKPVGQRFVEIEEQKIDEDTERFSFNTGVSGLMIAVNELGAKPAGTDPPAGMTTAGVVWVLADELVLVVLAGDVAEHVPHPQIRPTREDGR